RVVRFDYESPLCALAASCSECGTPDLPGHRNQPLARTWPASGVGPCLSLRPPPFCLRASAWDCPPVGNPPNNCCPHHISSSFFTGAFRRGTANAAHPNAKAPTRDAAPGSKATELANVREPANAREPASALPAEYPAAARHAGWNSVDGTFQSCPMD